MRGVKSLRIKAMRRYDIFLNSRVHASLICVRFADTCRIHMHAAVFYIIRLYVLRV